MLLTRAHHIRQGYQGMHCHHHTPVWLLLHTWLVQEEGLQAAQAAQPVPVLRAATTNM